MARDIQKHLVYKWEKVAYPTYYTEGMLQVPDARAMVRKVHSDVRAAGGFAPTDCKVLFNKRSGGACASWDTMKFTPGHISLFTMLHELAHTLTWNYRVSMIAMRKRPEQHDALEAHAARMFCTQGHGPRYVACYIALCERYAGKPAEEAVSLTCGFKYQGLSPRRVVIEKSSDGSRARTYKTRDIVMKRGFVGVDKAALAYWRGLLNGGK